MSLRRQKNALLCLILLLLWGCQTGYAPVRSTGQKDDYHVVQKGDTLYSIAFRYGLDYKQIAAANNIAAPYTIFVNQKLKLRGKAKKPSVRRQNDVAKVKPKKRKDTQVRKSQPSKINWQWPVKGKVLQGFDLKNKLNKGVDIHGRLGESVLAAADGQVVYAGGGLRGYGKLVILKHSENFLSAYGHNRALRVKEGDKVKGGQVVAEIGSSGPGQEMLHFEIRKNGKPEDPLIYLPRR